MKVTANENGLRIEAAEETSLGTIWRHMTIPLSRDQALDLFDGLEAAFNLWTKKMPRSVFEGLPAEAKMALMRTGWNLTDDPEPFDAIRDDQHRRMRGMTREELRAFRARLGERSLQKGQ